MRVFGFVLGEPLAGDAASDFLCDVRHDVRYFLPKQVKVALSVKGLRNGVRKSKS